MAVIHVLGLVLLSVASAFGGTVYDSNNYIDTVLQQPFRRQVVPYSYLDPYPMPNITYNFKERGAKVQANYYNGVMTGFSLVHRQGNCSPTRHTPGLISLNCTLALDNVGVKYKGKVKYGILPKISIKAKGNFTRTLVFVEVSQRVPYYAPGVTKLNIVQMGTFNSVHTGLGPANKFLSFLKKRFESVVIPQLFTVVNDRFKEDLQRSVAKISLPPH